MTNAQWAVLGFLAVCAVLVYGYELWVKRKPRNHSLHKSPEGSPRHNAGTVVRKGHQSHGKPNA